MLLVGLTNLGSTTLNTVLGVNSGSAFKDAIAGFGAVTLVGLPVWAHPLGHRPAARQSASG